MHESIAHMLSWKGGLNKLLSLFSDLRAPLVQPFLHSASVATTDTSTAHKALQY